MVERLKREGNYKSTVLAWHKNTRSRTFLTCCQAGSWSCLVSVADKTNKREREATETATVTGHPGSPRSVRGARKRSKFQILTRPQRTASRTRDRYGASRPVPSGGHAVNPRCGPRLSAPRRGLPADARARVSSAAESGWVLWAVAGGRAVGPTKDGGAREHHTATPHLPSIRLHTPLPPSPF